MCPPPPQREEEGAGEGGAVEEAGRSEAEQSLQNPEQHSRPAEQQQQQQHQHPRPRNPPQHITCQKTLDCGTMDVWPVGAGPLRVNRGSYIWTVRVFLDVSAVASYFCVKSEILTSLTQLQERALLTRGWGQACPISPIRPISRVAGANANGIMNVGLFSVAL